MMIISHGHHLSWPLQLLMAWRNNGQGKKNMLTHHWMVVMLRAVKPASAIQMVIFWFFLVDKQVAKQDFCLSMFVDHSSKPAVIYGPLDNCLASINGFTQKETTAREVLKFFCHSDPYDKVEVATGQSLTWHHNLGWVRYQSKGSKTSALGGGVINQQMLLLEASYLQNTCGS